MKNNKRNPLILLICIIILLIFAIIVLFVTTLPLMNISRENAFRIEANNIVSSAEKLLTDYYNDQITFEPNNINNCINTEKLCITVQYLNKNNYYDNKGYRGKIEIDIKDVNKPTYTLYLSKGAEFRFVGLNYKNYTDYGQVNNGPWLDDYELCSCETTD